MSRFWVLSGWKILYADLLRSLQRTKARKWAYVPTQERKGLALRKDCYSMRSNRYLLVRFVR